MTQKQQKLGTLLGVLCAQGCLLASDGNHEGIKSAPFNDVIVPVANLGPMAGPRVCKLVQNGEVIRFPVANETYVATNGSRVGLAFREGLLPDLTTARSEQFKLFALTLDGPFLVGFDGWPDINAGIKGFMYSPLMNKFRATALSYRMDGRYMGGEIQVNSRGVSTLFKTAPGEPGWSYWPATSELGDYFVQTNSTNEYRVGRLNELGAWATVTNFFAPGTSRESCYQVGAVAASGETIVTALTLKRMGNIGQRSAIAVMSVQKDRETKRQDVVVANRQEDTRGAFVCSNPLPDYQVINILQLQTQWAVVYKDRSSRMLPTKVVLRSLDGSEVALPQGTERVVPYINKNYLATLVAKYDLIHPQQRGVYLNLLSTDGALLVETKLSSDAIDINPNLVQPTSHLSLAVVGTNFLVASWVVAGTGELKLVQLEKQCDPPL
jgi:hypothetical protein